ncbi:ABC transporter ATP-binding protein [Paenibacillus sp. RC67]|uniref:ABC transporter ATP-binding protein n=1 Tax=Paenibacillus sp. RC67 TaxID=3039392 RepID=UPI0024ADF0E0|nr:ABC transporter ATP-binding protein [Paenibacillus sp. RC67]
MSAVLEVEGLNMNRGSFGLLDVSFSLPEGCITGFIGVNGAGKTTTIKSILGLTLKDSGKIQLFGKDMDKHERELKNRIGIVFDEGYFYEDLTMGEMKSVLAPAYFYWDNAEFHKNMDRFELNQNQKISTLSKGMRMKYAIALALSHHADLLIMDEPTSGLDPLIRSEIMEIMLEFMEQDGKSVFFSTHITSDLDKIADMLILIDKGHIILNEDKDLLLDTHGFVKGDKKELNEHTRSLFLTLRETTYGFEGLTNNKPAVYENIASALIEKPTIEDIMLGYIRR